MCVCVCVCVQAMGDADKQAYMRGQKTLEINPYHPLIQELKAKVRTSPHSMPLHQCGRLVTLDSGPQYKATGGY